MTILYPGEPGNTGLWARVPVIRLLTRSRDMPTWQRVSALATGHTSTFTTTCGWLFLGLLSLLLAGQGLVGVDPQDEGQFLTYPWLIAAGHVPYRDIWMSYPPATYLLLAALFKVGLGGFVTERLFGFAARLAYVMLLNRVVTGSLRRFSWLVTPMAFSLVFLTSDLKPYPWLVALPVFVTGLVLSPDRPIIAAAIFFAASTIRFEFAAAGLVVLFTLGTIDQRERIRFWKGALTLAGLTVAFFGLLSLVTSGWAYRDIFVDQVITIQRGRFVDLWSTGLAPLGLPILVCMLLGPLLLIVVGLVSKRAHLVGTNAGVLALIPHFFQRADASHLFSMSALAIPWTVAGLTSVLRSAQSDGADRGGEDVRTISRLSASAILFVGLTVGAWCVLIVIAYGIYLSPLSPLTAQPATSLSHRVVAVPRFLLEWDPGSARDIRTAARFLHSVAKPGDELFIAPYTFSATYTRTDLYYALDLRPAGRYLEVQPGLEAQPAVQRDIEASLRDCKWVLRIKGGRWYSPPAGWQAHRPVLDLYIAVHYRPVYLNTTYQLLKRV